jgi:DNA (cytosine-5)-methyltransferase 1
MDLAAKWAGIETVAFCEIEPFCQKVLRKNFGSGVTIFDDVRTLSAESLRERGVEPESISVVAGSLPCQPFSGASRGRQRGKADSRYLWPEMRRVVQECRPAWVVSENVTHFDRLALDDVLSDLEALGYEVAPPLEIPACAVDADHIRPRLWILGHADRDRESSVPFDAEVAGVPRRRSFPRSVGEAYGIPRGVDVYRTARLTGLGNALHPEVAYPIFEAIANLEAQRG